MSLSSDPTSSAKVSPEPTLIQAADQAKQGTRKSRRTSMQLGWDQNENLNRQVDLEVEDGCFSKKVTFQLATSQAESLPNSFKFSFMLVFIFLCPLLGCLHIMIPLDDPFVEEEGISFHYLLKQILYLNIIYPGYVSMLLVCFDRVESTKSLWKILKIALLGANSQILISSMIAQAWIFPIPVRFLITLPIGLSFVCIYIFSNMYSLEDLRSFTVVKTVFARMLPLGLLFSFIIAFTVYQYAFETLKGNNQVFIVPLWPAMKISYKYGCKLLQRRLSNPDSAPFISMFYDILASFCGQILFIQSKDIQSVFTLIFFDLAENLYLFLEANVHIQRFLIEQIHLMESYHLHTNTKSVDIKVDSSDCNSYGNRLSVSKNMSGDIGQFFLRNTFSKTQRKLPVYGTNKENYSSEISKAYCRIIEVVFSEVSEIATTSWMAFTLAFIYLGHNQEYYEVFRSLDNERIFKSLSFISLSLCCQFSLTFCLLKILKSNMKVDGLHLAYSYLTLKNYRTLTFFIGTSLMSSIIGLFLQHNGFDPRWDFAWITASNNSTL